MCTVHTSSIIQSCPIWHITMATRTIATYVRTLAFTNTTSDYIQSLHSSVPQPTRLLIRTYTAHCSWALCVSSEIQKYIASGAVTRVMDELSLAPSLPLLQYICVCVECTTHAGKPFLYTTRGVLLAGSVSAEIGPHPLWVESCQSSCTERTAL